MSPTPFFSPRRDGGRNRADDKMAIRKYLFKNPLASVEDISDQVGMNKNQSYRLTGELEGEGKLVHVTLGRIFGARRRYANARQSLMEVRDLTGRPIPWLSSETGMKLQSRRLPMVEMFNYLMPTFWAHTGVDTGQQAWRDPGPSQRPIRCAPDLQITDVIWRRRGAIDAVAVFEEGVWVAYVWIGNMMTERMVRGKASRAIAQLQGEYTPTAWALVGHDRLAVQLAADCWPQDLPVLAVSVDGHVVRQMSPGAFTEPLLEQEKPDRLGWPERFVSWLEEDENRAMLALNRFETYRMLRIMGESYDLTPSQMEQQFGPSYRGPAGALKKAGLLEREKGTGMTKLARHGMRTLAAMDRVSALGVYRRAEGYLEEGGEYRIGQLPHNRALNDVTVRLWSEGIQAFAGFRAFKRFADAQGSSRVSPDAVVLLGRKDGTYLMVYLELVFTARAPGDIREKLAPYLRLQKLLGHPVPLLFIAGDEAAERQVQRQGRESELELLLTTTLSRFEAGSSLGYDSVWRTADGDREDIKWLAETADWLRRLERDVEAAFSSDWDDDPDDDLEEPEWWLDPPSR